MYLNLVIILVSLIIVLCVVISLYNVSLPSTYTAPVPVPQSPKNQKKHIIWIYTALEKEETFESVSKVTRYLNNISKDIALIVDEKDIVLKMDTEHGLSVYVDGEKLPPPDVVWCRIDSSTLLVDFHVTVLRQLQLMGARIINNIEGVMKTTNKAWHLQELARAKIPIAPTLSYNNADLKGFTNVDDTLKYPIVMKMVRGNGGDNVFMVHSKEVQEELSGVLVDTYPYIYQTYIKESHGRDLRVIVVNNRPVFTMIRKSNTPSFRANLTQGGEGIVVTNKYPQAEAMAVRIASILNLDICGVDLLWSKKYGFVCCEVNNSPGFSKPIYAGHHIEKYIGNLLISHVKQT